MPANEQQQAMRKMPYWATNMSIQQLGTYLPPADTLPSVMPIHLFARTEYDEVEVHPCTQDDEGPCEQCDPNDPELAMWSCYLHLKLGGIECVADFENEKEADAYAQFLRVWLGQITMTKEQSKTIQDMRHDGCAVVVWNPDELRGVDPTRVEDHMIEKGGDYIEMRSPAEEEEEGVE
jgi:hypothetical protein